MRNCASRSKYIITSDIHYMACVLDPRYRQLVFASRRNRRYAVSDLSKFVADHDEAHTEMATTTSVTQSSTASASQNSQKTKSTRFEKYQDALDETVVSMSDVDTYLNGKFDLSKYNDEAGNFQILKFWQDRIEFPRLREVARMVLAIPAAETTDERNFSEAGLILTPKRTLLSGASLSDLLYVHKCVEAPQL